MRFELFVPQVQTALDGVNTCRASIVIGTLLHHFGMSVMADRPGGLVWLCVSMRQFCQQPTSNAGGTSPSASAATAASRSVTSASMTSTPFFSQKRSSFSVGSGISA